MSSNRAIRLAVSLAFFVVAEPVASASAQVIAQSVQHSDQGGHRSGGGGTDW